MLLSRYHGTIIDLSGFNPDRPTTLSRVTLRTWAYVVGSHACPDCIRETGAWQLAWKLPWSFVCVRHRRLLADVCPRCGRRLGTGMRDRRSAPAFRSRVPNPGYCGNPLPKGLPGGAALRCPAVSHLPEIANGSVEAYPGLLASQALMNTAMEGAPVAVGGTPVPALVYFADLRALCASLLFACTEDLFPDTSPAVRQAVDTYAVGRDRKAEARRALGQEGGDHRCGPRTRYFTATPRCAALMAAIVPPTVAILAASSSADLVQRMRPYVEAAERRSRDQVAVLGTYFRFSSQLQTAFDQCLTPSVTFARRAGLHPRAD